MPVTVAAFYKIIEDTWTSTLGFSVDRPAFGELPAGGEFTVSVGITGAWDGEVRLRCSLPLARLIAAAIFREQADQVGDEEVLDALSELIHIIGGNLKALLPHPIVLSLPCVPEPVDRPQATPERQTVCRLTLMSEGYPFVVTLMRGSPTAAADDTRPVPGKTRLPPESPRA